ncbi:MAG: hypothetical protein ACKOC5_12660 [Chloroflexota bacterium]
MSSNVSNKNIQRPMGVTILALLQLIAGLFGLCLPTILLTGGALAAFLGPVGAVAGGVAILIGLLMSIGAVLHLVVAFGALNLRPWAWWLGMVATGFDVLGVIVNLWNGIGAAAAVVPAAFSILVFIYLLTPGVRNAFRVD